MCSSCIAPCLPNLRLFAVVVKVMKKNKREHDEDSVRHGDQYDTQLLWFLMRHMRNRRPQRVSTSLHYYFRVWS